MLAYRKVPFAKASPQDPFFRLLNSENPSRFFRAHPSTKNSEVEAEFKSLLMGLLKVDPSKRTTVDEALTSPWLSQTDCETRKAQTELASLLRLTKTR